MIDLPYLGSGAVARDGLSHADLLAFLVLAWRDDAAGRLLSHRKAAASHRT